MLNLAQDVKILAGYCMFMRSIFLHNRILFENSTSQQKEMMSRVADMFFDDLSSMLRENIILQACRITDPAKDARGNENLTIDFLLQHFVGEPATKRRLDELNNKLQAFRLRILPARNKLISHLDREAIRSGAPLGGVPDSEWDEFWSNLQDLVYIIYDEVVREPPPYINAAAQSDADGLLKSLQRIDLISRVRDES